MNDCISRQAVIDAIYANCICENEYNLTAHRIKNIVSEMPSVTPTERTGHWIYTGDYLTEGMLKCSECGEEIDVSESYYDFCPVCGARMESEK